MCQRKLQVQLRNFINTFLMNAFINVCIIFTVILCFFSLPGFSGSEDCVAMETLLAAYDEQDEDGVTRVCNSPLLKYMDNDVSV